MRLIDADKLQQGLIDQIDWLRKQDYELYCAIGDDITFCIDKQPTAYDVDEVLKQLEDEKSHISLLDDELEVYKSAIDDAIEIVKAGGMNNNSKTSD